MTEIPEHLLKRSRAAKGQKTGEGDASDAPEPSTDVAPAAEAAEAAPTGPPALAEAAAAVPADTAPPPEEPDPDYIAAAKKRKKIPAWALPLVAAVPIWAVAFAGTMQQPDVEDPLFVEGAEIYAGAGGCAGCHGAAGGGGVGYPLSDGSVLETFPHPVDQMVHIARGSQAIDGENYGAERSDGLRVAGASGNNMPAFDGGLTQIELELVVFHERAVLSGEDTSSVEYLEWMEHMREAAEAGDEDPIDLGFLLACADPQITPGATGTGSDDPDDPCPGPQSETE